VQEVALGRPRPRVGKLSSVDACDGGLPAERAAQTLEPALVERIGVLADEHQKLALGKARAKVARRAVAELLGRDLVHDRAASARQLDAPIRGARVDHDYLDLLVERLRSDAVEAAAEVISTVLH